MVGRGRGQAPRARGVYYLLPIACLLLVACARVPVLAEYRNESLGFTLRHPHGWSVLTSPDGEWVQIVPAQGAGTQPDALRYAEFVSIRAVPATQPGEDDLRSIAFSHLPFHGVAKFQRHAAPGDIARYRFEGTGTSAVGQWAAVGLLVVGEGRLLHIVCAKPIERWRDGQRKCDDVVASVELLAP